MDHSPSVPGGVRRCSRLQSCLCRFHLRLCGGRSSWKVGENARGHGLCDSLGLKCFGVASDRETCVGSTSRVNWWERTVLVVELGTGQGRGKMAAVDLMEVEEEQKQPQKPLGEVLKQGAEARVFETSFVGRKAVVKERFSKKYRHPILDAKLTSKRLYGEARCVVKARRLGVATPALYAVDSVLASLTFEFVPGPSVKDVLLQSGPLPSPGGELEEMASQIGKAVARLHDGGLIHGDLTTSNMLIRPDSNQLIMIDFGLSFTSTLPEDKAVDLYVLERALLSLHSSNGDIMGLVMSSYKQSSKLWSSTLNKLAQVRMRGRKRVMIG